MAVLSNDVFSNNLDSLLYNIAMEDNAKLSNEFVKLLHDFEQNWNKPYNRATDYSSVLIQSASRQLETISPTRGNSWYFFNTFMDKLFTMLDPITYFETYNGGADYDYYLNRAGLYNRNGATDILGSDSSVLASGIVSDEDYAIAWNTLKIPYDEALNVYPVYLRATGVPGIFRVGNATMDYTQLAKNAVTRNTWSYTGPERCKDC